jgi:hypothetical protein
MYTRYVRGADGVYRQQAQPDAAPPQEPMPPAVPQSVAPKQKPPGILQALTARRLDTDDLLLAAIVLLLMLDGDDDLTAILAALGYLLL